jgi:hypothetical protein
MRLKPVTLPRQVQAMLGALLLIATSFISSPAMASTPMKYDDASWHYGGDFPSELPPQAGATHIAMFFAWAALNGLAGDYHTRDAAADLALLRQRKITPTEWFMRVCDEKFTDEDLNSEGNAFARAYYGDETGLHTETGSYVADYEAIFAAAPTLYHVEDSWASFDAMAPVISRRFKASLSTSK